MRAPDNSVEQRDAYDAGQVGDLVGAAAATVRRNWRNWRRLHDFPAPLPRLGRALLWDAVAVEGWRATSATRGGARVAGDTPLDPARPGIDWAAIAAERGAALDAGRIIPLQTNR